MNPSPCPSRALVVANPAAGGYSAELAGRVAARCRERLGSVTVHRTTGRGDATAAVRRELGDGPAAGSPYLVVAVGGDGTVHETAEGLRGLGDGTEAALLMIPGGSANSGYRMFWDDRPWEDALSMVLGGRATVRRVDLARLAEAAAHVLLGSCTGLGAQILAALRTARHDGTASDTTAGGAAAGTTGTATGTAPDAGRARYARLLTEAAAGYRPYPGRVTVDGTVLAEGPTVLAAVGGGRYRAGQYLLLPRSEVDDGLLDVCVVGGRTDPAQLPVLARDARHLDLPDTAYGRGRRIVLERLDGEDLVLEHDGELLDGTGTTATFDVLPGALPVWAAPHGQRGTGEPGNGR
ncbi:diacylglycerol/lipid kinase family protein [Streptomyces sp. CA-132043]|uniref:diacylglycerol/lipid kinase family protein n=1 Tax=Streptomyces sp. CA-132043 TaxID=3240048 RepID=UPI003D906558